MKKEKMKKIEIRNKIIEAAVRLFARKGFFETTVDDIAHAAHIAKGTIYLYFKDKPSLYIGIIEEHFDQAVTFLDQVRHEKISSVAKLKKITDDWVDYMMKFHESFPMLSFENINLTQKIMKGIGPRLFTRIEEIVSRVAEIIAGGIKNGELRRVNPRVAALHFLNMMRSAMLAHHFTGTKEEITKRDVLELFLKGLQERRQ